MDWHDVNDAFGPADGVPSLLAALASLDPGERAQAERDWFSRLDHQGSVYSATAPAIRTIIDDAVSGQIDLWTTLWLVAVTAVDAALQLRRDPSLRTARGETIAAAEHVLDEVGRSTATLRQLTDKSGLREKAAAALLTATVQESGDAVQTWLQAVMTQHPDPTGFWSAIDALLHGRRIPDETRSKVWFDTYSGPEPPPHQWDSLDVAREMFINTTNTICK